MLKENDHVKIKKANITGEIIDVSIVEGKYVYIVESDEKGVPGGYGGENSWKLFWCNKEELEKI
ncbi:MAG: hypothetical protein IJ306_07155 [Oscillospiraceae bacterium]|nr:hypothetical protein [Oscillospiraceae bacterium]